MSSAVNTLLRSAGGASTARFTIRSGLAKKQQQQQSLTRTYAQGRGAPLTHGGNNRPIIIGLVTVSAAALAYVTMSEVETDPTKVPAPALDPAARKRAKDEKEPDSPKYKHPEHEDPELKAPFGQVHKRKRVDGPPDDRNHQSLQDRNRQRD